MEGSTVLDASSFELPTSDDAHVQYVRTLQRNLVNYGFVRIVNHGIPEEMIHKAFDLNRRFFELPMASKLGVLNEPGPEPQRGYSRLGAEKTSTLYGRMMNREVPLDLQDAREHYDMGRPDDTMYPNQWISETDIPGFRHFMTDFYAACERANAHILAALEEGLQVPPGTFNRLCGVHNASELRLNRYPEISLSELRSGKTNRIWPHFDLGVVTLLFTDGVGGLEFQDRTVRDKEVFMPVVPSSRTEMIVNISETMQRWTHDALPAGLHRVEIPPSMRSQTDGIVPERYSIAYFCKADQNASVGALTQFVPDHSVTKYEDITALEYHKRRLLAAY